MKTPHIPKLREHLRANRDGMTVEALHALMPYVTRSATIRKGLERMPDAYIDRWIKGKRGQYHAMWCVVVPPAHCPHPDDRFIRTEWREI